MELRAFKALAGATWAEIARETGYDWRTVKRYLSADAGSSPPATSYCRIHSRRRCDHPLSLRLALWTFTQPDQGLGAWSRPWARLATATTHSSQYCGEDAALGLARISSGPGRTASWAGHEAGWSGTPLGGLTRVSTGPRGGRNVDLSALGRRSPPRSRPRPGDPIGTLTCKLSVLSAWRVAGRTAGSVTRKGPSHGPCAPTYVTQKAAPVRITRKCLPRSWKSDRRRRQSVTLPMSRRCWGTALARSGGPERRMPDQRSTAYWNRRNVIDAVALPEKTIKTASQSPLRWLGSC